MSSMFFLILALWAILATFGWRRASLRAKRAQSEATELRGALEGLMTRCYSSMKDIRDAVNAHCINKMVLELHHPNNIIARAEEIGDLVTWLFYPVNNALFNLQLAGASAVGDLLKVAAMLDASRGADLTHTRQAARKVRDMAGESAFRNAIWLVDGAEYMTRLLHDTSATPRALRRAFSLTHGEIVHCPWFPALSRFMAGSDQAD
ncbi:MAG: hypothetical protein O3B64_04120 [bacterium]|nr:hypothetical protein [bacterium]